MRESDPRRVSDVPEETRETAGDGVDVTEEGKAAVHVEHQSARSADADVGGVAVGGFGQAVQPVEFGGQVAFEVREPGSDAMRGGERRSGDDAGPARLDVGKPYAAVFHEYGGGGGVLGMPALEYLDPETREVHCEPQHGRLSSPLDPGR